MESVKSMIPSPAPANAFFKPLLFNEKKYRKKIKINGNGKKGDEKDGEEVLNEWLYKSKVKLLMM